MQDDFEWDSNDKESPAWVQKLGHKDASPAQDEKPTTQAGKLQAIGKYFDAVNAADAWIAEQHADIMKDVPAEAPPDLAEVTRRAAELKEEIFKLEATTKRKQEELKAVSNDILRALDLMDLESIKAHGYLFYKEEKSSVTTPKTPEQKQELFEFLKEQGIFLEVVSVNSQTLNALYKSLAEDAAADGILEFKMPGVGEPTTYTNLKLRRS